MSTCKWCGLEMPPEPRTCPHSGFACEELFISPFRNKPIPLVNHGPRSDRTCIRCSAISPRPEDHERHQEKCLANEPD